MKPVISVVIPAYNHEKFIGPAIDSVLGQSYGDLELIVIDDGSTDGTAEVMRGYSDSRLSCYYQKNQDAFNTLNRGLKLATGRYISILNSDDVYTLDRLERLLDLQQDSRCHCLFTDVIPISANGEVFTDPDFGWNRWHRKNRDFYRKAGDLYTAFLKGNFMVTTSNLFMTAEAVRAVGKFCSLRYLHDYDYIFRLMLTFPGQVKYVYDEKLLYYRIHGGNTLGEAAVVGREQDLLVIRRYLLARMPDDLKPLVEAGTDRLVELEAELSEVRRSLSREEGLSIRQAASLLGQALKRKIFR